MYLKYISQHKQGDQKYKFKNIKRTFFVKSNSSICDLKF